MSTVTRGGPSLASATTIIEQAVSARTLADVERLATLIVADVGAKFERPIGDRVNTLGWAIFMFTKLRTPVLGLVENMSGFECRHCGQREEIFGSGGARRFAAASEVPFLGEIPLSTDIRTTSDEGNPIVQSMPESPSARAFFRVAENLAAQVSTLAMGGVSTDRPEIGEITQPSETEVGILWKGGHESIYTGYALRVGCRCAVCVDEISGNKRLREESISKDVRPLSIDPVGRYAIRFHWSDGHSTGIYTFEHLRELCPCPICADNATL